MIIYCVKYLLFTYKYLAFLLKQDYIYYLWQRT